MLAQAKDGSMSLLRKSFFKYFIAVPVLIVAFYWVMISIINKAGAPPQVQEILFGIYGPILGMYIALLILYYFFSELILVRKKKKSQSRSVDSPPNSV